MPNLGDESHFISNLTNLTKLFDELNSEDYETLTLINEYINSGQYYKFNNKKSTSDLFSILVLVLLLVCLFALLICLIYLVKFAKHQKSSVYQLLSHFFVFKIFLAILTCLNIYSSSILAGSIFHIRKDVFGCFLLNILTLFSTLANTFKCF